MEENPFTMVYTTLWDMLLSHPAISRDVEVGNLIRFDSPTDRNPMKDTKSAGDYPQIMLLSNSMNCNLNNTSSTSMATRSYSWHIATGDLRYSEFLGRVEWYIFCAMLAWRTKLTALTWKNLNFVKRVNITQAMAGIDMGLQDKTQLAGWKAIWTIEVEMHFKTLDLINDLTQSATPQVN
jgi:hypothetical protein